MMTIGEDVTGKTMGAEARISNQVKEEYVEDDRQPAVSFFAGGTLAEYRSNCSRSMPG